MPTIPGGTILQPVATAVASRCQPDLLTKEDLFLLYAEFFFPYDIDPAGFGHVYGVYDQSVGETPGMCMSITDRQALMRSLWMTYIRMSAALRYHALPTYIKGERQTLNGSSALHLHRGYVTNVGERSCSSLELSVPLVDNGDGTWIVQVTMPSSTSIDDLVVYESGTRNQRVPIARRTLSDTTATLHFYRETLVSARYWAECGASRTSCDCSAILSDSDAFMSAVDVYLVSPVRDAGLHLSKSCLCTPSTTTVCGTIDDPVLGWVYGDAALSCSCAWSDPTYVTAYYTSGRWTRDTIPEDVQEALFGTAISLMPETSMCQEATRPDHFSLYRNLAPTDAPGGMRSWGQVLMRAVTRSYASGSGI